MSFGSKLRDLRVNSSLTQEQLAQKINRSKANISKYENDTLEPNLDTLVSVSNIFGVSIDFLLDNNKEKKYKSTSGTSYAAPAISKDIATIIQYYNELSNNGQEKAMEYIQMLRKLETTKEKTTND